MSDDFDLDPQARSKQDDIARKVAIVKLLRRKKFSSDEMYRVLYEEHEAEKEEEMLKRKDFITYQFNFQCISQAVAIILAFVMLVNAMLYIFVDFNNVFLFGSDYSLSWIMLVEMGVMFLFCSFTVPRKNVTVKRRVDTKELSPYRRDLRFAFAHSMTWFFSAIITGFFALMVYTFF
ncbi:MAG: hypothetical protein ACTSPT_08985 [Candidatus Heimdallarchaeota archaeon]